MTHGSNPDFEWCLSHLGNLSPTELEQVGAQAAALRAIKDGAERTHDLSRSTWLYAGYIADEALHGADTRTITRLIRIAGVGKVQKLVPALAQAMGITMSGIEVLSTRRQSQLFKVAASAGASYARQRLGYGRTGLLGPIIADINRLVLEYGEQEGVPKKLIRRLHVCRNDLRGVLEAPVPFKKLVEILIEPAPALEYAIPSYRTRLLPALAQEAAPAVTE